MQTKRHPLVYDPIFVIFTSMRRMSCRGSRKDSDPIHTIFGSSDPLPFGFGTEVSTFPRSLGTSAIWTSHDDSFTTPTTQITLLRRHERRGISRSRTSNALSTANTVGSL